MNFITLWTLLRQPNDNKRPDKNKGGAKKEKNIELGAKKEKAKQHNENGVCNLNNGCRWRPKSLDGRKNKEVGKCAKGGSEYYQSKV